MTALLAAPDLLIWKSVVVCEKPSYFIGKSDENNRLPVMVYSGLADIYLSISLF